MAADLLYTHPFTDAGLGQAPFRFLGCRENLYKAGNHIQPGGCCAYCSQGIRYEFLIQSADGKRSTVGCDCIRKVHDHHLTTAADKAKKDFLKARKAEQRQAKWAAILQEQRDRNGGKTDAELKREAHQAQLDQERRHREQAGLKYQDYAERLEDGKGGFRDAIAAQLRAGYLPAGRGLNLMLHILAKQAGRAESKAYWAEREKLAEVFNQSSW